MKKMNDTTPIDLQDNNLLRDLNKTDTGLLKPHFKLIQVRSGDILYEPGDEVNYTYFPCGPTLVSFIVPLADARAVETALVGREGAVGGIVSQGYLPAYCRALVQFSGKMLRIESRLLEKAKAESVTIRHLFARYSDCLLAQVFQAVACNATHTIEQRTAKLLIAAIDRTGDHVVPLKQDQLAGMMGVGRSYVARVISSMKMQGTLETARGRLSINNEQGLRALACDCNELVRKHFDDVLAGVYPKK